MVNISPLIVVEIFEDPFTCKVPLGTAVELLSSAENITPLPAPAVAQLNCPAPFVCKT